jgi:hypothetical protein
MADAGAVTVRALLEAPSSSLTQALEKLQAGLSAAQGLQAQVPPSTTVAIEKLRTIYSGLAAQIEKVDTNNAIRDEALTALRRMDIGLQALATGVSQGGGEEATRAYALAVRRLDAAGAGIDQAIARIH